MENIQNPIPAQKNSKGLWALLIVVIIILAVLFVWNKKREVNEVAPENSTTSKEIQAIKSTSQSDNVSSIDADLKATNVDTVDLGSDVINK